MDPYRNWVAVICQQLTAWGYIEDAERVTTLFNSCDSRLYNIYLTSVNSPGIDVMTVKDMVDNI